MIQDAPTIGDMMAAVNRTQNLKSNWQKIRHLQRAAKVLIFIQENGIYSIEQFADAVADLHQRQHDLAGDVKTKERRIAKLNEHIANVDVFNQHKAVYKKYKSLDPKTDRAAQGSLNPFTRSKAAKAHEAAVKKQNAYYKKHADEIEQYNAALKYLKDHLNGYGKIPEKEWRKEREELSAGRYAQVEQYYRLRDDVQSAETLRRGAETLMSDITQERMPTMARDVMR